MTTRGRLSPIAPTPRSSSPASTSSRAGNAGAANSGAGLPRPSISSVRSGQSLRKSEADFEAALLNPNTTFLSAGPGLAEEGSASGTGSIRDGSSHDAPIPIEKRSYEDDLRAISRRDEKEHDEGHERDGVAENVDDMPEGLGRVGVIPPTPKKGVAPGRTSTGLDDAAGVDTKSVAGPAFPMSTPKKDQRGSIGDQGASGPSGGKVVDRRTSHATMASQDSYGSPSRMSVISASSSVRQSMGLDAELNESQKMGKPKAKIPKRRSMFRSPGTASSPDLATLVRRAREAKASAPPGVPVTAVQPTPDPNGSPAPRHARQAPPVSHIPSSQSVGLGLSAASGSGMRAASTPAPGQEHIAAAASRAQGKGGPVKSVSGGSEEWDKFSDLKSFGSASPDKMATIAERPGSSRSRESSHDGSKSLRNKAKGVFGRMFGGSSSREHTPTTSPNLPTTARFNTPDRAPPPVPPVPDSYRREADVRRDTMSPTLATTRSVTSPQLVQSPQISEIQDVTPTMVNDGRFETPSNHGRRSVTPTGRRNGATSASITDRDKPLPPIQPSPGVALPPSIGHRRGSESGTGTLHRRQPAAHEHDDGDDDDEASALDEDSPPQIDVVRPSPRRAATKSFSDDVAGIFDSIGQSDPARELGLPPDSIRIRERTQSADVAMTSGTGSGKSRFPSDLGRSPSTDTPRRGSQGRLGVLQPGVATRTSSLPINNSPRPTTTGATTVSQRTASSPSPAPHVALFAPSFNGTGNGNGTGNNTSSSNDAELSAGSLVPPTRTLSRSSSTSSRRRTKTDNGAYPSLVPPPNLGSPLLVRESDFDLSASPRPAGASDVGNYDTLKPRKDSEPLPPLSPASVRLITAPQAETPRQGLSVATEGLFRSRSNLINTGAWGRQSPSPRPSSQAADSIELVHTPTTPKRTNGAPTAEDDEEKGRRLACEFLDDDYSSVQVDRVAEFLGGPRRVNSAALRNYMSYFDMKGQTLVEAFRDLCAKLHLKAESQEIDRILEGFSARYHDCNPSTVFGTLGVVHTVTAAMLMLNTDLHIADLQKHMSRADFVRNAMRAIHESMPSDRTSTPDLVRDDSGSVRLGSSSVSSVQANGSANGISNANSNGNSASVRQRPGPGSMTTAPRSASAPVVTSPHPPMRGDSERSLSGVGSGSIADRARTSAPTPTGSSIYGKAWEGEAENALKDIFNQVRADKILLPIGNNSSSTPSSHRQSVISLSSEAWGSTMRSPSGRSNDRVNALKRGSIRGMQGLMNHPYNSVFSNSDGRLSPTPSFATSINDPNAPATIGFASNLSHTVIKEQEDEKDSVASAISQDTSDEDLNDDELALLGAPWAKEGMLSRRVGTEVAMKKVGKKDWKQFFAVVQKGEMLLFTFGEGSGSGSFGAVGGGNWLNNANTAGRYTLTHAQATTVKGGYSRDRPYVFCLSLPSGEAVYLAAGTDDLVTEWVNTCNYWSARRSRQPLQGGVGNIEYGWSRVADSHHRQNSATAHGSALEDDRASIRSNSSKMSKFNTATYGRRSFTATPGDRVFINDWRPPQPSLVHSQLEEEAQYEVLRAYHRTLGEEYEAHRALEEPMMRLFTQGSKNAQKAHLNWVNKSRYLVAELSKYRTYRDTLQEAIELRVKKQGERKLEKSLARSMTSLHRRESADTYRSDDEEGEEAGVDDTLRYGEGRSGREIDGAATPVAGRSGH